MPRDDSGPSSATTTDSLGKVPLKRGDACLYCRKRRIRCSADKPSCQHCTKLKRECVYDTGKPVSRVKQLEDKVAELEGLLKVGPSGSVINALNHGGPSSNGQNQSRSNSNGVNNGSIPPPPPLIHHSSSNSSSTTTTNGQVSSDPSSFSGISGMMNGGLASVEEAPQFRFEGTMGYDGSTNFDLSNPWGTSGPSLGYTNRMGTQPYMGYSMVDPKAVESFDFSSLDPSFMNLVNSLGATSTFDPPPSEPSYNGMQPQRNAYSAAQQNGMDLDFNAPSGLTPFLDPTNCQGLGYLPPSSTVPIASQNQSSFGSSSTGMTPISIQPTPSAFSAKVSYHAYVTEVAPTPSSRNATSSNSPDQPVPESPAEKHLRENVIGCSSSADGIRGNGVLDQPKQEMSRSKNGWGNTSWKSWIEGAPVPSEFQGQAEAGGLMGGWFDPTDLPRVARDHLLDLFFSGMRLFGQEFHVPRFFASLSLPIAKRPHPCLLYTMYLMASRISTSVPIRSLEPHFYKIAAEQLDESIASADRLFDATRAATILAVYKYSLAQYHEGWMLVGRASRLALSCGLHAIPSSLFKPSALPADHRADLIGLMRQRSWILPPPEDAIALGERIWAFWSIYTCDRCASIASQWPPSIADDIVSTPYPRPLHDYELGLITEADDVSLSSIYNPPPGSQPLPPYAESTYLNIRIRTMAILQRAGALMYEKPEPGWEKTIQEANSSSASPSANTQTSPSTWAEDVISFEQYLNQFDMATTDSRRDSSTPASDSSRGRGWMRTAKVRNPKAYQEIYDALMRIEMDMPPERRTKWEVWDGDVQDWHFTGQNRRELAVLHFIIGCCWMFLFDVFSFNTPNDKAVAVARRLAFTVRSLASEQLQSDLDVFIAMTWSFIIKVLIRETKRLHSLGDHAGAAPIEKDVEVIVQSLQAFGKRYSIASYQAKRAEQFRQASEAETKFMEDHDALDDPHAQLPRDPEGLDEGLRNWKRV